MTHTMLSTLVNQIMKNQFDIISISHYFYPRVGGLENMAYNLLKYMGAHSLRALAIYGNDHNRKFYADGITHKSFNCIKLINGTYPIFGIRFTWYVLRALWNNPQAVVLIHDRHLTSSLISAIICWVLRREYIVISHTTNSSFFKSKIFQAIGYTLENTAFKWVLQQAKVIVAVSGANRDFLVKNFGIKTQKITVIYNGFNTSTLNKFVLGKKEKTVVFAARMIPVKDPETTASAFLALADKYPDWKFMFAGGECLLSDRELPQNLEYKPKLLPQLELFEILNSSAIYVNSSIQEGLPIGVLEAAALGNIPVLSDAPSNVEVAKCLQVTDYNFARQDVFGLVWALEKAIVNFNADQELAQKLSRRAYAQFTNEQNFSSYLNLINKYRLINIDRVNKIEAQQAVNLALNYKRLG
jgi:glycosyltransferase involved in cell wall biosynthesis